jgi:hypothetical protein
MLSRLRDRDVRRCHPSSSIAVSPQREGERVSYLFPLTCYRSDSLLWGRGWLSEYSKKNKLGQESSFLIICT